LTFDLDDETRELLAAEARERKIGFKKLLREIARAAARAAQRQSAADRSQ
jgi:hypothetical protein